VAGLPSPAPAFSARVAPLSSAQRRALVSWHSGCPVAPSDLRVLTVLHWGFDRRVHQGRLLVHRRAALDLMNVWRRLYQARFPIRRMDLIDRYGASDFRSIEADNTSAFNCRRATGSGRWSMHAYGLAIDVNPLENPYVSDGRTSHAGSRPFLDRSSQQAGVVHAGDVAVRAFAAIGWKWGGSWTGAVRDYQHFSSNGR
jgi:hypothetical protein